MGEKCIQLLPSQEKEASLLIYFNDEAGTNDDKRERMKKLLAQGIKYELTRRQKECVTMRFIHDLTVEEIAQELDLTVDTVYKHIRLARRRLKKLNYYL